MIYGYARCSTTKQDLEAQKDILIQNGAEALYFDFFTGTSMNRPEFKKLLDVLQPNDVILVYKLDRLGRNLLGILELLNSLAKKNIAVKSITEPFIDTSQANPYHSAFTSIFATFAQLAADLNRERVLLGIDYARKNGKVLGRPCGTSQDVLKKFELAYSLYIHEPNLNIIDICKSQNISKSTFYKLLQEHKKQLRFENSLS